MRSNRTSDRDAKRLLALTFEESKEDLNELIKFKTAIDKQIDEIAEVS